MSVNFVKSTFEHNRIALVGATGAVGRVMMEILEENDFPATSLALVASQKSAGRKLPYGNRMLEIQALPTFSFADCDLALFSAGAAVSKDYAPKAEAEGCYVIDNTSCFRYLPDIPLVIPEVNASAIRTSERRIIANPNCSTIAILVAAKPIHDAVGILAMNIATYQAVSGAGVKGIEELDRQSDQVLKGHDVDAPSTHSQQIAFNALPHIDRFQDNHFTREEMKILWETQKILDSRIEVNVTCVRVAVRNGHSAAVHMEIERPLSRSEARALLEKASGVKVVDDPDQNLCPTAVKASGSNPVYVGRIRPGLLSRPCLNFWVVSDNLRKGAALNSIQIARLLADNIS